jgi:hypothetical protein
VGLERVWVGWWFSVGCVLGMSVEFPIGVVVVPLCWDRVGPASNIGGHYVILRWGGRGGRGCVLGDVGCRFKVGGGPALRPSGFTGSRGLLSHLVDANLFSIVLQVGGGVVNE